MLQWCYTGLKTVAKIEISNMDPKIFSKIDPQIFSQNFSRPRHAISHLRHATQNPKICFRDFFHYFWFLGLKSDLNIFLPMTFLNVSNCWSEAMLCLVYKLNNKSSLNKWLKKESMLCFIFILIKNFTIAFFFFFLYSVNNKFFLWNSFSKLVTFHNPIFSDRCWIFWRPRNCPWGAFGAHKLNPRRLRRPQTDPEAPSAPQKLTPSGLRRP